MSRNASGTMSAVNGPYTANSTISSSAINARYSDVESEITDSLSRSGKGGMSAALKGTDGTKAAPALSFTSEAGSGLYRNGSNDVRFSVNATDIEKWTASGPTSLLPHTFTGSATDGAIILTPLAAPSAPTNGALWVETTTNVAKVRINGSTVTLGAARTYASISYQNTSGTNPTYSSQFTYTNTAAVLTGTGLWNTSTATTGMTVNTTNGTIQVTNAGTYEVELIGHWHQVSGGTSQMAFELQKNSSVTGMPANVMAANFSGAGFSGVSWKVTLTLAANDTLRLDVYNTAGASSTVVEFAWLNFTADKIG